MPVITLRDFIYDDLGVGVGGIRARAYAKTGINTRSLTHVSGGEDFSDSGTGMWELTIDTALSPTGIFTVEMYNPSTGQIRWRDGHIRLQVEALIGPDNTLPFPDLSVTSQKIADGAITNSKVSDNALASTKLQVSDRTVDQAIATAVANTGTLAQLFSWFGKIIRDMKGTADWKTAPATTLAAAYAHMTNSLNPHNTTAAQVGAVANTNGTAVAIRGGLDNSKGSGAQGQIYIARDTQRIYYHTGSVWTMVGTADYTDLENKPASTSQSSDFGKVKVGTTTLVADEVQDTLTLVAGSGISILGNSANDTVTISSSVSGTPGAHTHSGGDIFGAVNDSDRLGNMVASRYLQIDTNSQAANSGSSINSSDFRVQAGSVLVTVSGGLGTVGLPMTVSGYLTIVATNGDYDAYSGHIQLKDSWSGSDARFTIKTSSPVSQNVRVNYIAVFW